MPTPGSCADRLSLEQEDFFRSPISDGGMNISIQTRQVAVNRRNPSLSSQLFTDRKELPRKRQLLPLV